jgi:hypothetical protein
MKVIKKPNTDWTLKHTCKKCTAELEIEKTDVVYEHHTSCDPREPGSWNTWTARCPICSETIQILETSIPKAVQVEIERRCDNGPYGGGGYYNDK